MYTPFQISWCCLSLVHPLLCSLSACCGALTPHFPAAAIPARQQAARTSVTVTVVADRTYNNHDAEVRF
jgi:hypothetical protein